MLRIYGSARSRATRTLWMAEELGLKYEHFDYAPRSPATRTPEYLALNPNARVPTIDDDGFVLSESMAINLYLAKNMGNSIRPMRRTKPAPGSGVSGRRIGLTGNSPPTPTTPSPCPRRNATPPPPRPPGTRSRLRWMCWRSR